MYKIRFTETADEDVLYWKKSGQKVVMAKIQRLLIDMQQHPLTGLGKPDALRLDLSGKYSRRIDSKNRLVYDVDDSSMIITIHSLRGHY